MAMAARGEAPYVTYEFTSSVASAVRGCVAATSREM